AYSAIFFAAAPAQYGVAAAVAAIFAGGTIAALAYAGNRCARGSRNQKKAWPPAQAAHRAR
ncbi:MAG: hypothetical protein ACRD2F_14125, partial [Terriglobales bacterium]